MNRIRRQHGERRLSGDSGMTLLEMIVGMALMSIFMTMFSGAVILMTQATNKAESVTTASTQLNQAFLKLDKLVRYASSISPAGTGSPSGYWYVELLTTNTGSQVCTQLRINNATLNLEQRVWTQPNPQVGGAISPTNPAWVPLAGGVNNGTAPSGSNQPFTNLAGAGAVHQQLLLKIQTTSGNVQSSTSTSALTFSAVNSGLPAPTAPICQDLGRP